MSSVPKFAAVPGDGDDAEHAGIGDSPEEAEADFCTNKFADYQRYEMFEGEMVRLTIWRTARPEKSAWADAGYPSEWKWVLHEFIEERHVETASFIHNTQEE